ncbi:hypothetical protein [Agaribacterium sp. ZY112]|uniref:hypothetical protein n=1 Tax=Agaribacterium sp. ZY112 TaxID=3233574 RepID=UPI0035262280
MHIEHINISAPKRIIEKEKTFFCTVFNLEVGFRPDFSRCGYWLYAHDKAVIHLTESEEHYSTSKPSYIDHIAFQLTGLKQMLQKLTELDISFTTDSLPQIGMTQVFFKSPAGVGLEANFVNEALTSVT